MNRVLFSALSVLSLAILGALAAGCADPGSPPPRDGGRGDALDSSAPVDAPIDAPPIDAFGADVPPAPTLDTCEACTAHGECLSGFCAHLVGGEDACLPGCGGELPDCPFNEVGQFSCIFDASGTGIDANVCAPIGGPCCVDNDQDGFGSGVGCTATDCNDTDPDVHPMQAEICDGIDTNCNGMVDEPPTNCEAGYCDAAATGGTYEQTASAVCRSAACAMGTTTSCGLYTCAEGGGDGLACATSCASPTDGSDDDIFCIEAAHCEAGSCVADVVDGGTCDEDSDCAAEHCDSDVCCASGDCCADVTDCPGGGSVSRVCLNDVTCQGERGDVMCGADFRCAVTAGIPDDSACDSTRPPTSCGLYDPIVCTGAVTQPTTRMCATNCGSDTDCIDSAHCSFGFCYPDFGPGQACTRSADCMGGLFCADGVCCNSACTGSCEACDLPANEGSCTAVPPGGDPDNECAGFSCAGYFSLSGDICRGRAAVSDSAATCDGAGVCRSPNVLCPLQSPDPTLVVADCNDTCQSMRSGTCVGTTIPICDNIAGSPPMTSCGTGACMRTVTTCSGGVPNMCVAGTPAAEICDGMDNDCTAGIDNGAPTSLCPPTSEVTGVMCASAACSITGCSSRYADIDRSFPNGCECNVGENANCGGAIVVPPLAVGASAASLSGAVPRGAASRWYAFSFPRVPSTVRPGGGTPTLSLAAGSSATNFRFDVYRSCSADRLTCESGGVSDNRTSWSVVDDESTGPDPGGPTFNGTHAFEWPDTIYVRVYRIADPTTCAEASFTLNYDR